MCISPEHGTTLSRPVTIAFSGPDNVGKTKQIGILARRLGPAGHATGPLDDYDPRWDGIKAMGMGAWWFELGPVEEVADVLAGSYLERSRRRATAPVRLMDRGIPMLEASLAATVAVRERLSPGRAADRARKLLDPYAADVQAAEAAEYGIVLLHDEDLVIGTSRSLSHERHVTPAYADYQRHLHLQMHRLVAEDRWAETVVIGERRVVAVQDEIRRRLHPIAPLVPPRALPGLRVVALGGMSESGKSTAGEYLRVRHGYARLKIGYLIEDAAQRADIADPYEIPAVVRAELLVDGLDRFCAAHHFLDHITIESLHDQDATAELRRMLGEQLTVVYVDATPEVRAERGTAGPEDVVERDAVKARRGAAGIAPLAQEVIDNNHSRLHLERRLDGIALAHRWPLRRPATTPVNTLGLPVQLESYLSELLDRTTVQQPPVIDLLAVTGSGARGKYQHGWSDLDVFVVAEQGSLPRLRQALAELEAELGGVKLGLTVLTQDECRTGAVTSRLLHVLMLIGYGSLVPLWCRPGLALPTPDAADDVAASVEAGVQAAIEIRRQLLKGAPDLRALFKVTALLAKVMLRFEGTERASDDDALGVFLDREPATDADLRRQARGDSEKAAKLANIVLGHWLATIALPTSRA
ncbi:nucleotidyltransferase domain-containing protein [Kitasatospora purpeofusca]|uniref:nucleotidyltransferase domain-containing protein n=1 Tax=Kitasatospora purpeofusca TaxID=67352 RepID=UPI002A59E2BC|nr:nucleotidyltransferase domain-containing protein [Kitasatospora purpeofusca]MDY0811800.1 nucleotidyltransferase domain-containing protein [Kitasatospora purpeofusca]